jgi:acetoin utilization protein AcuB
MLLRDIMTRNVVTVDMDATLDHIRQLFAVHKFHHLVVTESGRVIGLVSDRDVLRSISPFVGLASERLCDVGTLHRRAHQIMTRKPVMAAPDLSIHDAVMMLLDHGVSCLPVIDSSGELMGIVTWRDLIRVAFTCDTLSEKRAA